MDIKNEPDAERYICGNCKYVYNKERGYEDGDIIPGTAFADIPKIWVCPACKASKDQFTKVADTLEPSHRIGYRSTGGEHEVTISKEEQRDIVIQRVIAFQKFWQQKWGETTKAYMIVIVPEFDSTMRAKADGFQILWNSEYMQTIVIEEKDFDKPPKLPTDGVIIFLPPVWEAKDGLYPFPQWCEMEYIKPEHWVLAMAKTSEIRDFIFEYCNLAEMWANIEMKGGVRLWEKGGKSLCDRYHLLSMGVEKDEDHTFIITEGECTCGISGMGFTVTPSIVPTP